MTYAAALGTDRLERQHEELLANLDKALATKDKLLLKTPSMVPNPCLLILVP